MRLSESVLRVAEPEAIARFYARHLGAHREPTARDDVTRLAFGREPASASGDASSHARRPARLELRPALPAVPPEDDDRYWKIGLTHADVDRVRAALVADGVDVTAPAQFRDVGYLCHLRDPEGFAIELLQHTFAGEPRAPADGDAPTAGLTLGQITLRVRDAERSLAFYERVLGMRLLSRQVVEPHAFTLYFLGCADEAPPSDDLDAVSNRPWLWQRPYTTLELQHRWHAPAEANEERPAAGAGFDALGFEAADAVELDAVRAAAAAQGAQHAATRAPDDGLLLLDPDGNRVRIRLHAEALSSA